MTLKDGEGATGEEVDQIVGVDVKENGNGLQGMEKNPRERGFQAQRGEISGSCAEEKCVDKKDGVNQTKECTARTHESPVRARE